MARAQATRLAAAFDPFLPIWRALTSVRFAIGLIAFLSLAGLAGVVLPQIPAQMRDNPAAVRAWLEAKRDTFGPLTGTLYDLDLFTVFDAPWFLAGLGLLVVTVTVCTFNRLAPTWRNVTRPPRRVPEEFFDRSKNRHTFPTGVGVERLAAELRRARYRVVEERDGDVRYLFADRFAWAQLGTFASHLALILFLAGGLVSRLTSFEENLFIGEGTTQPVFPARSERQLQIEVVDASASFDDRGRPLDFRSELVIYENGREVARGTATVNDPVTYGGYRFHQAAYDGNGVALRVRDAASGRTLYRETLPLQDTVVAPTVRVTGADGAVLLDDVIVPSDFVGTASGTVVTLAGGRAFWVGIQAAEGGAWQLVVFAPDDPHARGIAPEGGSFEATGLRFEFTRVEGLPSAIIQGIPGSDGGAVLELARDRDGTPYLTVLGATGNDALYLFPGQPVVADGREYTFEGHREFAGISVRRDRGDTLIWVATGLLLAGLLITFYVPRRRLWVRATDGEIRIASLAEKSGGFHDEMRRLARRLGVAPPDDGRGERY
jgi:cytochrome c biogenesis protein ResB